MRPSRRRATRPETGNRKLRGLRDFSLISDLGLTGVAFSTAPDLDKAASSTTRSGIRSISPTPKRDGVFRSEKTNLILLSPTSRLIDALPWGDSIAFAI